MLRILAISSLAIASIAMLAAPQVSAGWGSRTAFENGRTIATNWDTTGQFDGITLAGNDDVRVVRGANWQIRATGDRAVLSELRYLVEDGTLIVGRRHRDVKVPGKARIEITAPAVNSLTVAGSGLLERDPMPGSRLSAVVAGSGTLQVRELQADTVSATVAGSGRLILDGRASKGNISIAGSGDLDGSGLSLNDADVSIAGSGDARFRAERNVSASIVGSGDVTVTGPARCTQSRMGSGRLTCAS